MKNQDTNPTSLAERARHYAVKPKVNTWDKLNAKLDNKRQRRTVGGYKIEIVATILIGILVLITTVFIVITIERRQSKQVFQSIQKKEIDS
jgi:hypothetical protein